MIHLTPQQLSSYMDGELNEASTELVRRHMGACEECTLKFAHSRCRRISFAVPWSTTPARSSSNSSPRTSAADSGRGRIPAASTASPAPSRSAPSRGGAPTKVSTSAPGSTHRAVRRQACRGARTGAVDTAGPLDSSAGGSRAGADARRHPRDRRCSRRSGRSGVEREIPREHGTTRRGRVDGRYRARGPAAPRGTMPSHRRAERTHDRRTAAPKRPSRRAAQDASAAQARSSQDPPTRAFDPVVRRAHPRRDLGVGRRRRVAHPAGIPWIDSVAPMLAPPSDNGVPAGESAPPSPAETVEPVPKPGGSQLGDRPRPRARREELPRTLWRAPPRSMMRRWTGSSPPATLARERAGSSGAAAPGGLALSDAALLAHARRRNP